jgi:hypothetical protein
MPSPGTSPTCTPPLFMPEDRSLHPLQNLTPTYPQSHVHPPHQERKKIKIPSLTNPPTQILIPASASIPVEALPTEWRAGVTLHAKASSEHSSREPPRTGGLEEFTSSKNGVCGSSAGSWVMGGALWVASGIAQFWNLIQEPSHGALTFDADFGGFFCWCGGVPWWRKNIVVTSC